MTPLQSIILDILNNRSGGVKLTELLVEIMSKVYEEDMNFEDLFPGLDLTPGQFSEQTSEMIEAIEDAISSCERLAMMEYSWYGIQPPRQKVFVYTP